MYLNDFVKTLRKICLILIPVIILTGIWNYFNDVPPSQMQGFDNYLDLKKMQNIDPVEIDKLPVSMEFYDVARVRDWAIMESNSKQCSSKNISAVSLKVNYKNFNVFINTAISKNRYNAWPNNAGWNKSISSLLSRELLFADHIIFTETGPLWMDKVATDSSIYHTRDKIRVFDRQLHSWRMKKSGFPPAVLETIKPLKYKSHSGFFPGLVLIKPPDLRKDSQWIYVQLKNKKEFLIIDCFLPSYDCITNKSLPTRLWLWRAGYRKDVSGPMQFLNVIHKQNKIKIIMSCDIERIKSLEKSGFLKSAS